MGCTESSAQAHQLDSSPQPSLAKRLTEVISTDNLNALALLQAKEDFDANLTVSEETTQWSAVHLCCRFDAVCCLDFLLKRTYVANVKRYIGAVNARTSEGLSPLHLCGTWAAFKCFFLLLRYGGANLSALDGRSRTPQMAMRDSGLAEMAETLAALRTRHGHVAPWNPRLLHGLTDPSKLRSLQFHRQQFAALQGAEGTKEAKAQLQHEDEAKLWNEKAKLENECDALFAEIKAKTEQLQRQKEQTQSQTKKKKELSTLPTSNLETQEKVQKTEEILSLERQLSEKEQRIQRLKSDIRKAKSDRQESLLQAQTAKVDSQDPETKESLSKFAAEFEAYKEQLRTSKSKYVHVPKVPIPVKEYQKGKEAQGSSNSPNASDPALNFLPQNVRQRYLSAKSYGSFSDEQFPHSESSFGGPKYQDQMSRFPSVTWLRPNKFVSPNFVLFDGIEPDDIKQGELGVCYLLATIAGLARQPQRIKQAFVFADTQIGFYIIRLYTNGKPNYIVLDDYFPCNSNTKQPLFSRPNGKEIWVLLFQKGWAKAIGSYFSTEGMSARDFIDDLSGSPVLGQYFKDKKDKMKEINAYSAKNKLIVLYSKQQEMQGIAPGHGYSLLKTIEHKGTYIYKIRNPWGDFEWSGTYGDQSPQWTPQLRKKCEQKDGDDGIFFMTQRELLQAFEFYAIELGGELNSKNNYLQFQSQTEESVYFKFRLNKKGMMAAKVTQLFDRIVKDKDSQYKYSPLIFQLGKIEQNKVVFLSQGNQLCLIGAKTVFACEQYYKEYEAGEYFARISFYWNNPKKYNTAVFSVYCGEEVSIQRLQPAEGTRLWKQMIINKMLSQELTPLNDDVSYAVDRTRGQFICLAAINQKAEGDCFKVKWTFNSKNFKSLKTVFNRQNENILEFHVSKKQKYNFGTLGLIVLNTHCDYGESQLQSVQSQMPKESPQAAQRQQEQQNQQQLQRQEMLKQKQKQQELQRQQQIQRQQQQKKQQQAKKIQKQQLSTDQSMLPQNLKQLYNAAKAKGSFTDKDFPPNQSSLGNESHQDRIQPFKDMLVWLRPSKFLDGSYSLLDDMSPDDIRQGQVDTSYLLAALANYSQSPQNIASIFVFYDVEIGFYVLRFYTNGKPNFIVVDDCFPCDKSTKQPIFAFPAGNRLWVMLIEKAWAKIFGSYFGSEGMTSSDFMQDLKGGPTYASIFQQQAEDATKWLVEYANKEYEIVLKAGDVQIQGVVANQDYSMLKVYQYKGNNIYKIRNPWGGFEWNGEYGEDSPRWTPQLKKICDQRNGDDGIFFLSEKELLEAFTQYSVGMDEPNFKYSFTEFRSKPEQSLYFKFKLSKEGDAAMRVTQQLAGTIADQQYDYSPVIFELGKIEPKIMYFLYQGDLQCTFGSKSVCVSDNIYDKYQPGEYFVRVQIKWINPNKYNSAVLSVYCGESVAIERLKEDQGLKLWKKMVWSFMQNKELTQANQDVEYGIEPMNGQVICYASISIEGNFTAYKVSFKFDPKSIVNGYLGMNKTGEGTIEFIIGREEGYGFGVLECKLMKQIIEYGDPEVKVVKI